MPQPHPTAPDAFRPPVPTILRMISVSRTGHADRVTPWGVIDSKPGVQGQVTPGA